MERETDVPWPSRLLFNVAVYVGVLSIYYGAGLAARPPWTRVDTALDHLIPFVPQAQLGYALVYVVPVSALWLERTDPGMRRMMRAILLAYAIAAPFFLAMPVQDADPPLQPSTWLEHGLEVNRVADQTKNAFPSMHVGLAVLLTLIGLRVCRGWGLVLGVATAVIVVSTLLVKQHFLADLPAGAIVGWAAFRAVYGPVTGGPAAPARDAPSGP